MTKSIWEGLEALDPTAKAEALSRASGSCEHCGSTGPLEVHLVRLFRPTEDGPEMILGSETAEDLLALCRPCHEQAHRDPAGEYWEDPEEMAAEWEGYENAMDRG